MNLTANGCPVRAATFDELDGCRVGRHNVPADNPRDRAGWLRFAACYFVGLPTRYRAGEMLDDHSA
jgi:hypothetical protein